MVVVLTLKRNDTFPPVAATLTDSNGAINLSAATNVQIILKGTSGSPIVGICSIVNAAAGQVQYTWTIGDTAVADIYSVEFEINWAAGGVQTVPNAAAQNQMIEIDADLEAG